MKHKYRITEISVYICTIQKYNNKMKLRKEVLERIDTPSTRIKLASALNRTEQSIMQAIKFNRDVLTKYAALQVIKSETGLTEEEILVDEKATV